MKTTKEDFELPAQGDMFTDKYTCKHCGCIYHVLRGFDPSVIHPWCDEKHDAS